MDIITLKNGAKIELDYSFLTIQYLEDYKGGLKALKKDLKLKRNQLKMFSLLIYAAIRSNYTETLTFDEAVKLFDMKDLQTLINFYNKNLLDQDNFKKKGKKFIQPIKI